MRSAVRGVDSLIVQLGRIEPNVAMRVDNILKTKAIEIQNDAKQNLVDNGSVITANLKNSILAKKLQGRQLAYKVGTPVEYASYVEFGTSRSRPKPYLEPALKSHKNEIKREIRRAVRGGIRSVRR